MIHQAAVEPWLFPRNGQAAKSRPRRVAAEVDDLVCLESYEWFRAIGLYYDDFHQITDLQVIRTLARFPAPASGWGSGSNTTIR
jgi:hypothetical protein